MSRSLVSLLFLLFFAAAMPAALSAWGRKEKAVVVQATGTVRLVGSAFMPELVITGSENEWYIDREEHHKLFNYQQRIVTVEGIETVIALTFANGYPAGERRTLKKIKIISVQ